MFVKATQPQLGISDPYQLTEEQYQAVLKVLRAQHSLIHRYWHDTTVQMSDFKNEGVVASSAWPYQANALKAEGQPVATVFPKEVLPVGLIPPCCIAKRNIRFAPTNG